MVKEEIKPYGYIYVASNRLNGKVYVGQTITSRWRDDKIPIEERWNKEIQDAYGKKRRGEGLRYIENAIIKYGRDNFNLEERDIANDQEELDAKERHWIKELDAMNREKGYNMTEGGLGGRPSQEVIEKLRKIGLEKAKDPEWHEKVSKGVSAKYQNDPEYKEKQTQERRERAKDPEWRDKMTKINQERAKDPEWRDKMAKINQEKGKDPKFRENVSNAITKKWDKDPEYRKKQENERKERSKDPNFINKMREIGKQYRKEISDKRQFLNDIKNNMYKKDMLEKYNMGKHAFNKRIQEMFGLNGPKNYTELKDYLQDKNINDVLKEIEEREAEERGDKLETEEDTEKSEEIDKESSEDRDSPEEKEDGIGEKDQSEEAEGEKEKSIEEEKDEESEETSEEQVAEPKDPSIGDSTGGPDSHEENQSDNSSDNISSESLEKPPHGINLSPVDPAEQGQEQQQEKGKEKEKPQWDENRDNRRGSVKLTSGAEYDEFGNKISTDYEGIDQGQTDKGEDFKGLDEYDDKPNKDYDKIGEIIDEKGSDFDGIDSSQEKDNRDYDYIDEGHPEGNVESGGEP